MPAGTDFVLYFNLAFFGVIGLGMLIGFLRGFKKSIFSFITTVIFYVVFFFTIDLAVNFLWTFQVPQLGSWVGGFMPQLSTITTLSQAVPILLESFLGEMLGAAVSNAQLLLLVNGLAIFAVKIVWTLLYFTIILVIYKLICAIIFSLFFHTRKVDQKYASKNRGLGAAFGLLEGTVSVFVSLIMLGGLISVCESLVGLVPPETEDAPSELALEMPRQTFYEASYSLIPTPQETAFEIPAEIGTYITMLQDMVTAYNTNIVVTTANMATMTDQNQEEVPLNLYLFDEVLSFDYQANASDPEAVAVKVSIRKELVVFAEIAAVVLSKDISSGNVAQMGITREDITTIFTKLSESDLITSIIPLGIEISAQFLDTELEIPVADLYEIAWKEEIADLGLIVATVYEIADSVGFFEEGGIDYETVELDAELIDEFFTSLADSELITLAAFVAVEPLMAMAGEQINAVITVPADMDWSDEFRAIGLIVAEVLASDASIADIMSGDYTVLALALTEVDFEVLLNSQLVTNAMINVLSGNSGIPGLEFLEIPEGTIWLDQLDNEGNIVAQGELRNILQALNAVLNVASGISDLTNVMNDPSQLLGTIGDMTDEDIDAIFGSGILVATLSTMISDLEMGDFALVIPDDVYDVNGYILKSEFVSVAHAARVIATDMACNLEDTECATTGFDISKALNLPDDSIDTLLTSEIIAASVGKLVYDMAGDPLVVPLIATETLVVDATNMVVVSDAEIRKVFKAVSAIGIEDINNIEFNASILDNLAEPTDPLLLSEIDAADADDLDDAKINNLLGSDILLATIADVLIDLTTGEDSLIVIPFKDVNGVDVRTMDLEGIEYISVAELKNVLNALLSLDITDFENMDSLNLNLIIDNSSVLLNSAILHATVSKQLFDLGTDMITIPYFDQDENPIRITVGVGEQATTYLVKSELEAAFDALVALDITDINTFDGSFDMSSLTEEGNVTILLGSAVIHATVSTMLFDMTEGEGEAEAVLAVPYFDQEENPIRITVGDVIADTDTTYLDKNEIESIVDALDLLGISTSLDTFDGTFDMEKMTGNIGAILESAVIHATVSKTLFDMADGVDAPIEIPHYNDANELIRIDVGDVADGTNTEYLLDTEIIDIVEALDLLGISTSLDTFDGSFDMEKMTGNITALLDSAVIHATVSKTLFDMADDVDAPIEIPFKNAQNQSIRVEVGNLAEGTNTEYLLDTEIINIVEALDLLGITTSLDTFDGTFDMTKMTGNISALLESAVIHATVSKTLFDMAEGVDAPIEIPYYNDLDDEIRVDVGDIGAGTHTEYLLDTEIIDIVEALDLLGITTSLDTFDGSFDMTKMTGNISALLESAVIHATVSKTLFDMADGVDAPIQIPHYSASNVSIRVKVGDEIESTNTEYLLDTEIIDIVEALDLLGITTSLDTFDGSFDMTKMTGNISALLESAVIHATVSKTLFDMGVGVDAPIEIPYYNDLDDKIRVDVGDAGAGTHTEYLLDTEIIDIVEALDLLGITTSLDTFDGTFDMTKMTGNISSILESAVIHATISKTLFDMGVGVDAPIEIPFFNAANSSIRVKVGDEIESTNTEYLLDTEIIDIVEALDLLGITTSLDTFDGNFDLTKMTGNIGALLESAVIHATISKTLFDMDSLTVPFLDEDEVNIVFTVGNLDPLIVTENTTYIIGLEIENLVAALNLFGDPNLGDFGGTFDLSTLMVPGNLTTLLTSAIIHASISDTLLSIGTVAIPYLDEAGGIIIKNVGVGATETLYVTEAELTLLVDALDILGITDINSFTGTVSFNNLFIEDNLATVLLSSIIQATVSEQMFDLDTSDTIHIPVTNIGGTAIVLNVGEVLENTDTVYVKRSEIEFFFEAMHMLAPTNDDVGDFSGNFSLTILNNSTNQDILLASATMHATISETLDELADAVLIIPLKNQLNADIKVMAPELFVVENEIIALINAFLAMGFTDLNSFGGAISSTVFFDETATLLLSASIQATISDKMLNGTGGVLIIPDTDSLTLATIRFVHPDVTLIDKDEISEIMAVLDAMGLEDFSTMDFNPANIFAMEYDTLLASASMRATVSDTLLDVAADETAATGFSGLIVPLAKRETIQVNALDFTQIESIELRALLESLKMLGIGDFSANFSPAVIMLMTELQLNELLDSGSIHITIDKMLKGNTNISGTIPDLALFDMYTTTDHPIAGVITKAELVAFIRAVQTLGGDNFTTFNLDPVAIYGKGESDRAIIVNSMIVRNSINEAVEDAIGLKNFMTLNDFIIDAEDYMNNDISLFFTYEDEIEAMKFLNDEPFTN